jgi:O-succinylbenzoic acid--CoA ligase
MEEVSFLFCKEDAREAGLAALLTEVRVWSYQEMDDWTGRIAERLLMLLGGEICEQRVALCLGEPTPSFLACFWAVIRAGWIVAPISTRLPMAQVVDLAEQMGASVFLVEKQRLASFQSVAQATKRALFCIEELAGDAENAELELAGDAESAELAKEAEITELAGESLALESSDGEEKKDDAPENPHARQAFERLEGGFEKPSQRPPIGGQGGIAPLRGVGQRPTKQRLQKELQRNFLKEKIKLEQPATLVLTSGSTRSPKAALHQYAQHYFSALGSGENIPVYQGDRWLLSLPVYHVAGIGLMMRSFVSGAAVAIPRKGGSLRESIERWRPTHLSLVPTQLASLMQAGEEMIAHLRSCRAILLGGSAQPMALLEAAKAAGLRLFTSYGSTEMASQITTTPPDAALSLLATAGYPLRYREVRLDEAGEIWVRGATRFAGYWRAGEVEKPFDVEGWFATGDLGEWTPEGALRILGRKDAMFISGGENIQPAEVEWHLHQYAGLVETHVVDIPDALYGARPVAFVRMEDDAPIPVAALRDFLEARLPRFKIPDHFFPYPLDLPTQGGIKRSLAMLRAAAKRLTTPSS